MTEIAPDRLDTLVIARLATSGKRPPSPVDLVKGLRRFSPRSLTDAQWGDAIASAIAGLQARDVVDAQRRVRQDELPRRIGRTTARAWKQLAERVLPALALGIAPGDAKAHKALGGRDEWVAAIAARVLGLWTAGPPPSPSTLGDALVWQELGLAGAPKRCPPEVRAHFIRPHADGEAGTPDRLMRAIAARAVDAPRVELKALRDSLVRLWLAGREVGERVAAAPATRPGDATTMDAPATMPGDAFHPGVPARSLLADVQAAANAAREGVFGDRKVFISSVWEALRAMPAWASLELDDLKAQLVAAHRNRELVLARADLVAAMDPTLVAASETRTDGATFHFIVREPSS